MLTTTLIIEVGICYIASTVHRAFHASSHAMSYQFCETHVPGILHIIEMRTPGVRAAKQVAHGHMAKHGFKADIQSPLTSEHCAVPPR